jgi:hypothetical protein
MCNIGRKSIYKMKTIKEEILSDAMATVFENSKKVIILKRIIVVLCVIIACLIAGYFL